MESLFLGLFNNVAVHFTAQNLISGCITMAIAIAAFITLRFFFKRFKKKMKISEDLRRLHLYTTIYRIAKVLIVVVAIMAVLQSLGVNTSMYFTLLGLLVLIIILAVKDSFQDIFTGMIILFDKYFTVGDAVEYEGRDGIVVSFTVRTTQIEFLDDRSVMSIANRNITKIRKLTHLVDIDLPLSYDEDRKHVFEVLSGICEEIGKIGGVEKCELKGTQDFSESAVIYKIRFFCEPTDRPDIRREVLKTIQDGLRNAKIRIPYRQLDIHQKGERSPLDVVPDIFSE